MEIVYADDGGGGLVTPVNSRLKWMRCYHTVYDSFIYMEFDYHVDDLSIVSL